MGSLEERNISNRHATPDAFPLDRNGTPSMPPLNRLLALALFMASVPVQAAAQSPHVVDDVTLRNPPPEEWLTYGRDHAETRFSPLDKVHRDNVHRLSLAWVWDIPGEVGAQIEGTPLVWNGVLYATGAWNVVFALDARTGEPKWIWDPALVRDGPGRPRLCCGAVNRGLALYRDKLYMGLLDGRLVALDAETGRVVWVRQTTPPGSGYSITGAPRIAAGKVIIGNGGAEFGVRGYVTAYDAETGEQVWRFHTVPGDPSQPFESPAMELAASTWSGEWWRFGGGGTVWDGISYDPEANLVYIGTGNGYPWSHHWRSRGVGDNLFLASIVALDADTGRMVWHYQTTPGENWDYTATSPMILADLVVEGRERKVLMQAPKNGFLYVLDRLTGELISARQITEHVTWASGIDRSTGRPIETAEARYDAAGAWISPGTTGAHNWHPPAFSPRTGLVYIPGQNEASFYRLDSEWGSGSVGSSLGIGGSGPPPPPRPHLEPVGFLVARDPVTQEDRWRIPYPTFRNGGTLVTAGDLLFAGRRDGWLDAHDAETGAKLWEHRVDVAPASPITYEVDGRQYVTVMTMVPRASGEPAGRVWTFSLDDEDPGGRQP